MVLYILNRKKELLTALHNDSELDGILSLDMVEDLAELSTLDFDVSGNTDGIEHLAEENYILTQNMASKWKLFVTRKVSDIHGEGVTKRAYAEDILSELGDYTVGTNYLGQSVNVKTVLTALLKGTSFTVGKVDTTIATVKIEEDTRYMSKLSLLQLLAELTDLHIFTNVGIEGTKITSITISLTKTNKSEGKRFEFDGELASIQRDVDSASIKTAILPLGKAKELPAEGMARGTTEYITISDVEWFKNEGKPLDKPKGSELLIDPEATAKYGIKDEKGVMQPRVIVMQFDIDDPELLAEKAYLELDKLINPQINYTFSANDMSVQLAQMGLEEQPVEVGDVCYVIDNNVNPPIVQEVVIRRIAGNPDDRSGMEVEIGKPVSSFVDENGGSSFTGGSTSGGSGGGGIQDGDTVNALTIINGTVTNLRVITGSIKNLTADVATVEDFKATTANIKTLMVNNASFDEIMAGKADIGTVEAVDAELTQLKSEVAYIDDLTAENILVDSITGEYANLKELLAGNITADNIKTGTITAESGVIGSIDANTITTGTLDASKITVINLSASSITTGELDASQITVKNIDATHIGTGTLDASKINVINLSADSITTGTLDASKIIVTNLNASNITAGTLDASKIKVINLNADSITAGTIDASKINVNNINASNITTGTIDANKITISNMNAGSITGGTIDAVKVKIINLNASNITSGEIDASRIIVKNLNASNITGGTIDGNVINVKNLKADSIVAGAITVQGENLLHRTAFTERGGYWSAGTIDTARQYNGYNSLRLDNVMNSYSEFLPARAGDSYVISCRSYYETATKPATGTLIVFEEYGEDVSKGRIAYQESVIPDTVDKWGYYVQSWKTKHTDTKFIRLRFYQRATGKTWLAQPMLSRGTIASVWKPHTDELISDGAIDNDKIKDETIKSDKLFLDEILASKAFIEKFRAVEIDANQIRVNKITADQLDIEGIISFQKNPDLFGEDMEWIFDTSQDQTWINGGAIWANSVTADKINAKGLKIETSDKVTSFQVFDKASADASDGDYLEGDVLITGTLKSSNFDEATNLGYKISKDGDVNINNAIIRGDVLLPSAGITNYGGFVGNENLAVNSQRRTFTNFTNVANNTGIYEKVYLPENAKVGDVVTVSFTLEYKNLMSDNENRRLVIQGNGDVTNWASGSFGVIQLPDIEWNSSGSIKKVHKIVLNADHIKNSYWLVGIRADYITSGEVSIVEFKAEKGDKATPWCPHTSDQANYVRFWAGTDFENRDNAPFQVMQDGTVKATVGEFGGTFTGKLEIGNIHISDTNTSTASIKINTNNNAQTLIEFTEDTSFINTDFIFGTSDVPKFTYTKGNGSFKFSTAPVSIEGTKSFVYFPADNSPTVATVGLNGGSYGDYSHEIKYNGGGLRINQTGVTGGDNADIQFTKNDGSSDVNVSVTGNVQVTNTIQLGGIQIVNRTVGAEKRIDFVVL